MSQGVINHETVKKLEAAGINVELTGKILDGYNNGDYSRFSPVEVSEIPEIDGDRIIDLRYSPQYSIESEKLKEICKKYKLPYNYNTRGPITLSYSELEEIGYRLFPLYSCGILNGGASTSYVDSKKNRSFHSGITEAYSKKFTRAQKLCSGLPKGITPGFFYENGDKGPSFMKLKILGLFHASREAAERGAVLSKEPMIFQMTSRQSDPEISEFLKKMEDDPDLIRACKEIGFSLISEIPTAIQPLICAFTRSNSEGRKDIFLDNEGLPIALPGGHGQSFSVLKDILKDLYKRGKRFISLGNIDNNGYVFDPTELALLALSEKEAGFDFSFKTAIDVKGGILIKDKTGRLNCADIGVGMKRETLAEFEKNGKPILFNCASGLFSLEILLEKIDLIIENLPLRFSDQDKDRGKYSQAEQITWEVLGVLDNFLIFAVEKTDKFLASKLLIENFLTSGVSFDKPFIPQNEADRELIAYSRKLQRSLKKRLKESYGL